MCGGFRKLLDDVKRWTWHHGTAFWLTFFLYGSFHVSRKAFSNVKSRMGKTLTPDPNVTFPYDQWRSERMFEDQAEANVFLGNLDLSFFLAYAFGLFLSGWICDRVNLRLMLTVGLFGSAICTCTFGYLSAVFHVRSEAFYIVFFFLNGLIQSTGRPAAVAVMGNWFSKSSSGLVFGVWSCCGSAGNIVGALLVAGVIEYGYEYGMLMVSLFSLCAGVICFVCLKIHPKHVLLTNPDDSKVPDIPMNDIPKNGTVEKKKDGEKGSVEMGVVNGGATLEESRNISQSRVPLTDIEITPAPIKFYEALLIPGVITYSLANACLKMVNYAFLFWLPAYLSMGLGIDDKTSDNLSNLYDVGGMIGGIFAGVFSDFIGYRAPVVTVMLMLSMGCIYLYQYCATTMASNVILMLLVGFLLGGPANTISATIAADLGKHKKLKQNSSALGTVTGIVEGTGSVGAAIGQRYVAVIQRAFGWTSVFYTLIITTGMSVALILPILVKECRKIVKTYLKKLEEERLNRMTVR